MATITVSKRYNPATQEKNVYGGNIKSEGVISLKDIAERIQGRCTITTADIMTCLQAMQTQAIYALRNAQSITLGNLGTLYVRLKSKKAVDMESFTAQNLKSIKPGFKASKTLKYNVSIAKMKPIRVVKKK